MVEHAFRWNYEGVDVRVTGDFDNWSASTSMQKTEQGHFFKVVDLPANTKVSYKFVVDGHWCVDGQGLREGEGAHENNYVLTGAQQEGSAEKTLDEPEEALPVLGHAATYVSVPEADEEPKTAGESNAVATYYDDQGPSPSDPQAVRQARENPVAHNLNSATEYLPTREELTHEVQHVAEVAGGFLAAGLAAGAAAFGLSVHQSHTEDHPLTGASTTSPDEAQEAESVADSATPSAKHIPESVVHDEFAATPPQSLEQAAVATATSAATSAYNASGMSGLHGVTAPVSSLSQDGNVGFTGIGTAVNPETGIVGTSKIVQGVDDATPTEDVHTAKLAQKAAESLLQNHVDGAKVERISEHAVLAEVGIGGAAVGTAIVTDRTVSNSLDLAIPAKAAEHLSPVSPVSDPPPASSTVPEASLDSASSLESGLAPALGREVSPREPISSIQHSVPAVVAGGTATAPAQTSDFHVTQADLGNETSRESVLQTSGMVQKDNVVEMEARTSSAVIESAPAVQSNKTLAVEVTPTIRKSVTTSSRVAQPVSVTAPGSAPAQASTFADSSETSPYVQPVMIQPTEDVASSLRKPETTSSKMTQAQPVSVVSPGTVSTQASPAKVAAHSTSRNDTVAASPSKAAAQAATKNVAMRKNAREQMQSESSVDDGAKQKKGILRRMKSMFNNKQK